MSSYPSKVIRALVESRAWRAAGHIGTAQLIISTGVSLIGAGGTYAALSKVLANTPLAAQVLITIGGGVLVFGLLLVVVSFLARVRGEGKNDASEGVSAAPEFRRAVDVLLTWVYRRRNWSGISALGRYTEGAPENYGQHIYDLLDLDARYKRATTSVAEPDFERPEELILPIVQDVGTYAHPDPPEPVLDVSAYPSPEPLRVLPAPSDYAEFVHLRVDNDPERSPVDAADVFIRLVVSADTRELVRVTARPRSLPNFNANEDRVSIRRGDHEDFDVACRFLDDPFAYVVNSESFLMNRARKPEWRLAPGSYQVVATLFHAQGAVRRTFRLVNNEEDPLTLFPDEPS